MNFQDASNLQIPEGYVRTIHDKNSRLLWGSVGYDVSFDGNATQGELPSQYRQVEYVEATGTQYVNTGVSIASAGAQWSATIDIQYTAVASSSQIMLGTGTSAGGWSGQNGGFYALGATNKTTYASTQRVQAYVTFGTSASITIESETITRAGSTPSGSVYLLAAANGDFACEAKLYSCKIYNASNVLVRDFVPCVRKSDSVAGLYDTVNMAFYVSDGADAFSSGPDSPTPSTPVPIKTVQGEQNILITGKNLFNGVFGQGTTYNPATTNRITSTQSPLLIGGQDYTIRAYNLPSGMRYAVALYASPAYPGSHSSAPKYDSGWKTTEAGLTFTPDSSLYGNLYFAVIMSRSDNTAISPSDVAGVSFQLELGTSSTDYEQYQEQNFVIDLSSKNKLNLDDFEIAGLANGAPYASIKYRITNPNHPIAVTPGASYVISSVLDSAVKGMRVGIQECAEDGTFLRDKGWQQIGETPYVYTPSADCYNLKVVFSLSTTSTNVTTGGTENTTSYEGSTPENWLRGCKLQIERGSQVTPYTPYFAPKLAKVGAYTDKITKVGTKWYVEKQTGSVVLDGSETWQSQTGSHVVISNLYTAMTGWGALPQKVQVLCPIATYSGSAGCNNDSIANICAPNNVGSNFLLDLAKAEFPNIAALTSYLSANPITVYYVLAASTTTEITDATLIAQLEAVYDWVRRHGYSAFVTGDLPIIINRTALPTV